MNPDRPVDSRTSFESLFDTICRTPKPNTPDHALRSGVDVYGLCRYAAGVIPAGQRAAIERQLCENQWALSRVSALVKVGRRKGSRAWQILQAARNNDLAAVTAGHLDDPDRVLALELDSL